MAEYSHLSEPDPEFAPYLAGMMAIPPINDLEGRRQRFDTTFLDAARKTYAPNLPHGIVYCIIYVRG
jgi:hypothetical protein